MTTIGDVFHREHIHENDLIIIEGNLTFQQLEAMEITGEMGTRLLDVAPDVWIRKHGLEHTPLFIQPAEVARMQPKGIWISFAHNKSLFFTLRSPAQGYQHNIRVNNQKIDRLLNGIGYERIQYNRSKARMEGRW